MRGDAALIEALERAHIHPLWDRYKRATPVAPRPKDPPMHWRWRDLEPFAERAAREVGIEDVERRALILANPAFGGETVVADARSFRWTRGDAAAVEADIEMPATPYRVWRAIMGK